MRRWLFVLFATAAMAQAPKPTVQAQGTSTVVVASNRGQQTIQLANVNFEVTGSGIPGLPASERLLLRKTTKTSEVADEVGMQASTTIEAWPLGTDVTRKPLYRIYAEGVEPMLVSNELIVISMGLEDTQWWSVYRLATGAHLFDTYTPLEQASISRETRTLRYAGFEVPPDDTKDARLRAPNVVGVLTLASADKVIHEALVTCDDAKRAQLLRSYADSTRALTLTPQSITLTISQGAPSQPASTTITVPLSGGDMDLKHGQTPKGLHIAAWKR